MKNKSLLNQLDPRSKMIFTVLIITSALLLDISNFYYIIFFIGLLLTLTFFSGYSFTFFIGKLLKIYPMIFLITFLLPFQSNAAQTDILLSINRVSIYESGLMRFSAINLKYIIIILSTLILRATTPFNILIKGLESVRLPGWFLAVLTFMFRLIYVLEEEVGKMHSAFQSRYISLPYFLNAKYWHK
jgi:energy-coupling factor transporter transmembrane protein EcfT